MEQKRLEIQLFGATLLLLIIAASRFVLFSSLSFDQDEVWSAWQSAGSLQEIIARTPFDWTPGYYVLLGMWQWFAGFMPFSLRLFSLLWFMLSCAFTYQLGKKLFRTSDAALLVMVSYAAMTYVVYLSILLRAYVVIMTLLPLGMIFVIQYFEKPSFKAALKLGILTAAMFYLTLSAVFGFAVLGAFSLVSYGRRIWRWYLPGLIALVLVIPELWEKMHIVSGRVANQIDWNLPPLPIAVIEMIAEDFGTALTIWFILGIIATLMIMFRSEKPRSLRNIFIISWMILSPAFLYLINPRTGFFRPRYGWWIAWAFALWLGYGLSLLPKLTRYASVFVLVVIMFLPTPAKIASYKEPFVNTNFEANFAWLAENYVSGDVVVVDPNIDMYCNNCLRLEVWNYYERVYFPNGLNYGTEAQTHDRRVWYLRTVDTQDKALYEMIQEGRVASIFNGSPEFLMQLYVGAPDPEGILFDNGMRFHGYEVLTDRGILEDEMIFRLEGSQMRLRLWWSVDRPLEQEYSVGIQIVDRGGRWGLYAQDDRAPQAIYLQPNLYDILPAPSSMTTWEVGQYYVEERIIDLPYQNGMLRTNFEVFLTVYQWWDNIRIEAPETNDDKLLSLFNFVIMAW